MIWLLVLAACAALVLALVAVSVSSGHARRPPLRTRREEELAEEDEELLLARLLPSSTRFDLSGPVLDLTPVEREDHPTIERPSEAANDPEDERTRRKNQNLDEH